MRVEESVEIARSPQEVWDFVVDPMNDPRWCHKKLPRILHKTFERGVRRDVRDQLHALRDLLGP